MKWKLFLIIACLLFSIMAFIKVLSQHNQPKNWIIGSMDFYENNKPNPKEIAQNRLATTYNLVFNSVDSINSSAGTKSVLFNSNGSKLYAMNLEGLSIYEFETFTRKLSRTFRFKSSKGMGWDYKLKKVIPSLQEKPVEACLSNDDKIIWVSLHNAGGIVPIYLDTIYSDKYPWMDSNNTKKIIIHDYNNKRFDSVIMPLVHTGLTPKVIAKTMDDKFLLVSNWHAKTISVIELDVQSKMGKLVKNIPVTAIPRGIVVDDKLQKTYVAIMGSSYISVLKNNKWVKEKDISVASNPRHIVMDKKGRLIVSFNILGKIACIEPESGKTLFMANTSKQPRTIVLSKDGQYLFVTCYEANKLEVFKVENNQFTLMYSLPCFGKPVGADVVETKDKTEVWVCNYVKGNIKIFTFNKK